MNDDENSELYVIYSTTFSTDIATMVMLTIVDADDDDRNNDNNEDENKNNDERIMKLFLDK